MENLHDLLRQAFYNYYQMEKLNNDHMEKLMDKKDVARAFGVTIKAVDKWVCDKKLPYIKISPKCVRFRPSAIRGYLNSRTVRPEVRNSLTTMQGKNLTSRGWIR